MTRPEDSPAAKQGWLRRGWVQGILIALTILLATLAILFWSVVPLLNRWLPPALDYFVAPGSHLRISHLTRDYLEVESLNLTPAPGINIQIRDARLDYQIAGILQGEAERLSAASVTVVISADDADSSTVSPRSPATTETEVSLPQIAQLMSLPVNNINVDSFSLHTPDLSLNIHAELTPQLWWLRGDAHLPHIPEPVQLEAQLQRGDARADLLIMLSDRQTLLAQLWSGLQQKDGETQADLRLNSDLARLRQSLPVLNDQPVQIQSLTLSGRLSSPDDALWPQDLSGQVTAELTSATSTLADGMTLSPLSLSLSAQHSDKQSGWKTTLTTGAATLDMLLEDTRWVADLPSQQLTSDCNARLTECTASGQISTQLRGPTTSSVKITPSLNWLADGQSRIELPVEMTYQQPATADLPGWTASSQGTLTGTLSQDGLWQLTSTGLETTATFLPWQGWSIDRLQGTLFAGLNIQGDIGDDRSVTAAPLVINLAPFNVTAKDINLGFARSKAECDPGTISLASPTDTLLGNCSLELALRDSQWGLWPVPDVQLSGPLAITYDDLRQRISASLGLTAANQEIRLRTRFEHDLQTSKGSLQWHLTDAHLDWQALGLLRMASLTSVQLLSGHLSGQGWIDWHAEGEEWTLTPDLMLRADGVSAIYDNTITLEDWNAMVALRRPAQGDYLLDAQVSGSKLDSGIPLTNILARSQTRIPEDFSYFDLSVHEMHTDLLGGRVYTPLIRYDSRKEVNAFGVRLDHLQLSQIAAIEESAGVKATGLLDGMLPVVLTREGPMVPGGNLFARDPGGVIRYQGDSADALAQSDQSVGMAMKLLQNFEYDQLQSGVQYQPDGQLNLSLQFQGKNPDFFGGQATHLNVNLDYNLLDLLESLRISNEVIETIEQKYQ